MKAKLNLMVLCLLMLLLCSCNSNSSSTSTAYSLHSGVLFGYSIDDVIKAESSKGFEAIENQYEEYKFGLSVGPTIVAGIEGSWIDYYFYEEKLFQMKYSFLRHNDDMDMLNADYNSISESLTKKYGETPYNSKSSQKSKLPSVYHDVENSADGYDGAMIPVQYEEWVIPTDNNELILIHHYSAISSVGNQSKYHILNYVCFDAETSSRYINQQDSLNNDL